MDYSISSTKVEIHSNELNNKNTYDQQEKSTSSNSWSWGKKLLLLTSGIGLGYLVYRYLSSNQEIPQEQELQKRDVRIFKDGKTNGTLTDVDTTVDFKLELKDKYHCLVDDLKKELHTQRKDIFKDCHWGDRTTYCREQYINGFKKIHKLTTEDIPKEEANCYLEDIKRIKENNLYPDLLNGDNYKNEMSEKVSPIWNLRQNGFEQSPNGKNTFLHWTCLKKPEHSKIIMIIQGRTETDEKYQEVIVDFFRKGFDVCTYSNRGQGQSTHLNPADSEMHHLDKFRYMVNDAQHMSNLFNVKSYQQRVLLGHSMGGAIASRLMQTPGFNSFQKLVLTSPAVSLQLPAWQQGLVKVLGNLKELEGTDPQYGLAQGPWKRYGYENNELSNSKDRFEWWQDYQETHPQDRVGGMSSHCAEQIVAYSQIINSDAKDINKPTLIVQPQKDTSIDESGVKDFCSRIPQCQLTEIPHAQHEILMEEDFPRGKALVSIFEFLQQDN